MHSYANLYQYEEDSDGETIEPQAKRMKPTPLDQAQLMELSKCTVPEFPSGWMARIEYGNASYNLDSDILRPVPVPKDDKAKDDKFVALPAFNWDNIPTVSTRHLALQSLDQAFVRCLVKKTTMREFLEC